MSPDWNRRMRACQAVVQSRVASSGSRHAASEGPGPELLQKLNAAERAASPCSCRRTSSGALSGSDEASRCALSGKVWVGGSATQP